MIRVGARDTDANGLPLLTTLVEVGEPTSRGFLPRPFPDTDAVLELEGAERPAELVDRTSWAKRREPGFGTAWLVVLDTERHMGAGLERGKEVALALIDSVRENDALHVAVVDDRRVITESRWLGASDRAAARAVVSRTTLAGVARNRPFATLLETVVKDAFGALPSSKLPRGLPMHQALLVISTGYGGADPKSTGPGGAEIARVLERGRFPEDNTAAPKTPVPVISVGVPFEGLPEHRHNALELMRSLATPRIGGSFWQVEPGDDGLANRLSSAVRARFDAMHVVRWRLPCVRPAPTQSLQLAFPRAPTPIVGDATFRDVPLGPALRFPLLVDVERTRAEAESKGGVTPGGRLRVYGRFCWGGDRQRPRALFVPRGAIVPESVDAVDSAKLERARTDVLSAGLAGEALRADPSFVEVAVPDDPRILHGGPNRVRVVLEDGSGPRHSGLGAKTLIELPARRRQLSWLWWAGAALLLVVAGGAAVALRRSARGGPR